MFRLKLPQLFKKRPKPEEDEVVNPNRAKLYRQTPLKKVGRGNRSRRLLIPLALIAVLLCLVGIFWLIKASPFVFKNVSLTGSDLSCVSKNQIWEIIKAKRYNYFNLNPVEVERNLKSKYLCLESLKLKKEFPSTLQISLNNRQAVAVVKTFQLTLPELQLSEATSSTQAAKLVNRFDEASQSGIFLADNQGVLFDVATGSEDNLPIISYFADEAKLGFKIPSDAIPKILQILDKLAQFALSIKQIKVIDDTIRVSGDQKFNFSLKKDLKPQLISLQLIWQQATIESKVIKSVDLRFDKAVVVYSAK